MLLAPVLDKDNVQGSKCPPMSTQGLECLADNIVWRRCPKYGTCGRREAGIDEMPFAREALVRIWGNNKNNTRAQFDESPYILCVLPFL
jgi:hypothetical protein